MKQRYTVRRGREGDTGNWVVFDNQAGVSVEQFSGRDPARHAARRYNHNERLARDDEQQSKEETI